MRLLPEGWRRSRDGSPEAEAARRRRQNAAAWQRDDRALARRRAWRRIRPWLFLAASCIGLLTLAGLVHWGPAAIRQAVVQLGVPWAEPGRGSRPTTGEFTARVVGIADGDTLTVLTAAREQVRVRLAEIDAPETRQPYGARARQTLAELAAGQSVRITVVDIDQFGRTVGRVRAGPVDVNAEMVRQGAAWVFTRFSRDPALPRLEAEARAARRGLWALPPAERIPPWEWREAHRN
jgi:endonuclease YncB( thermonuclease family)